MSSDTSLGASTFQIILAGPDKLKVMFFKSARLDTFICEEKEKFSSLIFCIYTALPSYLLTLLLAIFCVSLLSLKRTPYKVPVSLISKLLSDEEELTASSSVRRTIAFLGKINPLGI